MKCWSFERTRCRLPCYDRRVLNFYQRISVMLEALVLALSAAQRRFNLDLRHSTAHSSRVLLCTSADITMPLTHKAIQSSLELRFHMSDSSGDARSRSNCIPRCASRTVSKVQLVADLCPRNRHALLRGLEGWYSLLVRVCAFDCGCRAGCACYRLRIE